MVMVSNMKVPAVIDIRTLNLEDMNAVILAASVISPNPIYIQSVMLRDEQD